MTVDRRSVLGAGTGLTAFVAATASASAGPRLDQVAANQAPTSKSRSAGQVLSNSPSDQTDVLQSVINEAARRGTPLSLPAGRIRVRTITLPSNLKLIGAHGLTVIEFISKAAIVSASNAVNVLIQDVSFDGAMLGDDLDEDAAVLRFSDCVGLVLSRVTISRSTSNGLTLERCSGRVSDCAVSLCALAGIRSIDGAGIDITHNHVSDCFNNGIQVWRSAVGEDGTTITGNRIQRVQFKAGGTGENGNGVSVFRAGSVLVSNNRITDCAYTAVRGNAASNIQIIGNSCARLGEVAIFVEFGFEGAVVANNLVDGAATGISITNFNEGGRLAVVQGNLVRNLVRREFEPEDKCGDGITVEADSIISANVIEGAATSGIKIGWGPYMRNCIVSQNLIRNARSGILITRDPTAGSCLVTANMISGAKDGAIRAMDHGTLFGPDLAVEPSTSVRVVVAGNMVG
jgi:uncharacterized secreted repeat protein (TIGR03808 family)